MQLSDIQRKSDVDYSLLKGVRQMTQSFDKLLSGFGYLALDMIFGINSSILTENELKKLVTLAGLAETDDLLRTKIDEILDGISLDDTAKRSELLLSLISG